MTSTAPTPPLGRQLLDSGWRQGALLSASNTEHAWARRNVAQPGLVATWEWKSKQCPPDEWWVVASQDCDISANAEPRVEFLRAFWTSDKATLRAARLNSARRFLLSRRSTSTEQKEGLVVDATVHLHLEKNSLLELSPSQNEAPLEPEERRQFAEWLARRYSRPAIPDNLVLAVQKPLVESLRKLKQDDSLWTSLERLAQIRFSVAEGAPPFKVSLVCIFEQENPLDVIEQADIQGWCSDVLDGKQQTELSVVEFRSAQSISLADFLSLTPLPLDEFSLQGD